MPRPNLGPRLILRRQADGRRPLYHIRWTEFGRTRWTSAHTDDPETAKRFFEDWLDAQRRARRRGDGDPAAVGIADILIDYHAEHTSELAAPDALRFALPPLLAFFAADTVASATPARVKEYWFWRRQHSVAQIAGEAGIAEIVERGVSDGTIIRELAGVLRPALAWAIAQKRLAPGSYHIPVPPTPPGRDYWLTRAEAARLLHASRRDKRARLHLPLYILIALYTGQRRRAILDLTWKQIDLVTGIVNFNPPGRVPTAKRRPILRVPRQLLAALRRAQIRASCEHVIAYEGAPVCDVKKGFASAALRAGIPACTSHTLRHTAGTWMAERGVPIWEIAGYLGHSVARTTELYAHHHPDTLAAARAAFERH
jgi:integrase